MSATNAQVVTGIEALVAPHVEHVLRGYFHLVNLPAGTSALLIDLDRVRTASDRRANGVLIDLTVLVTIDQHADDFRSEKEARQAAAQDAYELVRQAITGAYDPWQTAWVEVPPRFGIVRVRTNALCAAVSAAFGFAL